VLVTAESSVGHAARNLALATDLTIIAAYADKTSVLLKIWNRSTINCTEPLCIAPQADAVGQKIVGHVQRALGGAVSSALGNSSFH
jgi:hypothetical protein